MADAARKLRAVEPADDCPEELVPFARTLARILVADLRRRQASSPANDQR